MDTPGSLKITAMRIVPNTGLNYTVYGLWRYDPRPLVQCWSCIDTDTDLNRLAVKYGIEPVATQIGHNNG